MEISTRIYKVDDIDDESNQPDWVGRLVVPIITNKYFIGVPLNSAPNFQVSSDDVLLISGDVRRFGEETITVVKSGDTIARLSFVGLFEC